MPGVVSLTDPINLNHEADSLTASDHESDSEYESQPSSPSNDSQPDREVNKAALKDFVLAQVQADTQKPRSSHLLKNAESDQIIDRAREYQLELFERAKDENIITVLDTGSGKTLIAALLIRHFLQQELVNRSEGKPSKIVFFLVNSVHLARQQARFLNNNLPQNVIPLFGDSSDDLWRKAEWERIFADNSVVVCTAAVLDQCLMHNYLTIGQISLLVFDEAHHCKKNHPYSRIIRDYYLKWKGDKPRLFSMTASPIDSKGDIVKVVEDLEALLQSKIVTTSDMSVFDFAPRAKDVIWVYPPLSLEVDTELCTQLRPLCGFIDDLGTYFRFSRIASRQLGTWAANRIWKYALPTSPHESTALIRKFERSKMYIEMTDGEAREASLSSLRQAFAIVRNYQFDPPRVDADHELSSKVKLLHKELTSRFSASYTTRSIVFVEERLTALILCDLFESLGLTYLRPGILVGGAGSSAGSNSWKDQEKAMDRFRTGHINIIFATNVAEEGIDIPQCNLVVRFNLYKTPIQYTQSRGRARVKDSIFAHMLETGNHDQESNINYAMEQDDYIRRFCQKLPADRFLGRGTKLKQLMARDASCPSAVTCSGVVANYANSLLLLSRYADSLRKIGAVSSEVYEEIIDVEHRMFQYRVILPATADERTAKVKGARGEARPNKILARRAAAWRCVVALRREGLLDDNLDSIFFKAKPHNLNARTAVSEKKDDYDKKVKPDFWINSGAGSETLPIQLFATHVLVGPKSQSWTTDGLLLLTRASLPDIPSFPVFVNNNVEKHVIFSRLDEPVLVTPEHLEALTAYTLNGVFHDVFNKVFDQDPRSMSYWLAPPIKTPFGNSLETVVDMDELGTGQKPERRRWKFSTSAQDTREEDGEMWCKAFLVDPGSGRFRYFTDNILPGKSIWDAPPDSVERVQKRYKATIIEFTDSTWRAKNKNADSVLKKYDPNQPVLNAKLVMAGRNFLEKCAEDQQRIAMCHVAPQPLEIGRLSYSMAEVSQLWPGILHRLEAYLIVQEAYDKLDLRDVPLDLALEAFTQNSSSADSADAELPQETQEDALEGADSTDKGAGMNYERLEFLGDSLLKMTTTITIYNRTTCNEEGMHCKRMALLSNSNLCSVASSPRYELFQYVRSAGESWRDTWYPEFLKLKKGRVIKLTDKHRKHALGKKTIADVCEATIGACIMTDEHLPTEEKFDLGIKAITKLVDSEDHAITSWKEIASMYKPPTWSLQLNDPIANDLADKMYMITDYRFKAPSLLRSAFTHSSDQQSPVPDLQRLEFLGDACLDWVCIKWLFSTNPTRNPQWLTEHKMAMVSNKFLAALAVDLGFNRHFYATSPAVFEEICSYAAKVQEVREQEGEKPDFWTRIASGTGVPKALADLVESYLGAVLVDSGFDFREIEKFFEKHVKWYFEDIEAYDTFANRHPTTHLYRLLREEFRCRKSAPEVIELTTTPSTAHHEDGHGDGDGADDDEGGAADEAVGGVTAHVAWFVHGRIVAQSKGQGSKYAKVRASKSALKILGKLKVDEFRKEWGCDCARKGEEETGQGHAEAVTVGGANGDAKRA